MRTDNRRAWFVAGSLVLLMLQGCASIVSGTAQSISVDSPGCVSARCELTNDKGKYFVTTTPGTVTVNRSYNNLQVACTRETVTSTPLSVASTTKGMAFGNILFGGVIGVGVDVATGAAYDYPQLISVPMQCDPVLAGVAPLKLGLEVARVEAGAGGAPAIGVRVVQVAPGSMADQWGVKPGDVLLRINGNVVQDPDGLAALVAVFGANRRTERELELLLRRAGAASDEVKRVKLPAQTAKL